MAKRKAKKSTQAAAHQRRKRAFLEAYLSNGFNATKAAKAAGYSGPSAANRGSELVKDREVQHGIQQALADAGATRERIIRELARTALEADIADYQDALKSGDLHALRQAGVDTRQIRKINIRDGKGGRSITLEMIDRQRALEQLAKVMGLERADDDERDPPKVIGFEPPEDDDDD